MATANRGKAEELRELLRNASLTGQESALGALEHGMDLSQADIRTLADYPELPAVEETGTTFAENALLKARAAWQGTGLPALADDSGLEIDVLNGAPGVYSARFAGVGRDDEANIRKVLSLLGDTPPEKRTARFQCALAFVGLPEQLHSNRPEQEAGMTPGYTGSGGALIPGSGGSLIPGSGEYVVVGSFEGVIISEKRGSFGFGYDPIFYIPERTLTLAQLLPREKNAISHRARAFAQILPILCAYLGG
ncbi:MAG: non-canonical purine NTP pyrophosphatase [Peptococcaceae bacterium]|nr:non-canonical purine NTP pyrophosphatase [Peptococcaceae bacterium]